MGERRVLTIAVVVMLGLMAVGVVSAEVFTRSACAGLEPRAVEPRAAGALEAVLSEALSDLDDDVRLGLLGALDGLRSRLGPISGAADVRGAEGLAAAGDGVAATGATTTVLDPTLTEVRATAEIGGTVVGSGSHLWSLALVNELTGQVDALVPVDPALAAADCFDTATVGVPLAFHLAADDGDELLFRVEDDASAPTAELRRPLRGAVWTRALEVPVAPPGVLAERTSGGLGPDVAVVARRTSDAEEVEPAVVAFDRTTGVERWRASAASLLEVAPDGEEPVQPRILAVGREVVLVGLARLEEPDRVAVVGLDAGDGTVRWQAGLDGRRQVLAVEPATDDEALLVVHERGATAYGLDLDNGRVRPLVGLGTEDATDAAAAVTADGRMVVGVQGDVAVVAEGSAHTVSTQVRVLDVLAVGSRVLVLLASDEGAVVVGFEGS